MKLYATSPTRSALQMAADVGFLLWLLLWLWVGNAVHDGTLALAEPGERTASSADRLAGAMDDARSLLGDVPLVGDGVAAPFGEASDAAEAIADAGRSEVEAVEQLAFWLGFAVTAGPIAYVGFRYLPWRLRFVREASAGQRFLDGPADLQIFALRAITSQPLHVLARVTDDPVGALRRDDEAVIAALAALELRGTGLVVPAGLAAGRLGS